VQSGGEECLVSEDVKRRFGAEADRRPDRRRHVTDDAIHEGANQTSGARLFQVLGPGLVTGAADDDPSGIATYSQVGAQFGYGLAWTLVFSYPLMAAIQEISARIGRVTGLGIAGNLRRHYSAWLSGSIVLLLLTANLINLGADLGAMGAALQLIIGGPALIYVVLFAMLSCVMQIFTRYERYTSLLKWGCLALLTYVVCAFVVGVPWDKVGWAILWPPLSIRADYLMAVVAVFGTTISPYLFFWQAGQEVEKTREDLGSRPLIRAPRQAKDAFNRIRIDTYIGMGISNFVALCIVITTAAALNAKGVIDIQTSAQAAEALRSVAGPLTFAVFAAGIIGTGMMALPALAGSAAYALGETLSWRVGLARAPRRAKEFYATITVGMLLGVALNFSPIDPIKALYWSAVLNGVVAVPLMVTMMFMTMRRTVMAEFTLTPALQIMGWLATATMASTVVAMIWSWVK
jgi:NRAMP (natural resistance-associated macrophage protein)-like metal ion transporter